jgi:hypothetical protein
VVTIALERAASAVSGQIEDSSGGPVIGALVTVFPDADGETVLGASLSDAEGAFVVPARPGPSRLRVVADGYASWQRDVMAPSSGVRVVMAMGSAIVGHVTEAASRRPLAGVVVQATRNDVATGSFGMATTSFDGAFAIRNLGPGTHLVQVVGEEWAATSQEVQLALGAPAVVDFAATRAGRVEVTVTVGGEPCLRGGLILHGPSPGGGVVEDGGLVRVSGLKPGDYTALPNCANARAAASKPLTVQPAKVARETWDLAAALSIQGRVVGGAGEAIKGLTVQAFDPASRRSTQCTTGEQGSFNCVGLVAGRYRCWVSLHDVELSNVVEVSLTNDSDPGKVELTLLANGSVRVTVKDAQGRPLDGSQLALKAPGKAPLPGTFLGDGRSEFSRIPVGSYDLELEGSDSLDPRRRISVESAKMTEVSWVLPARDIEGRVLDAAGRAQPDTWVSVWGASSLRGSAPEAEAMTDSDGRFLLRHLTRRQYALRIEGPGGTVTRSPVAVVAPLTLYLEDQAGSVGSNPARAVAQAGTTEAFGAPPGGSARAGWNELTAGAPGGVAQSAEEPTKR